MSSIKVTLDNYEPIGHQVLVKLDIKGVTDSGIILDKKKADKWMLVTKVGSMVTAVVPGDLMIMGEPRGLIHLEFGGEMYMQVMEHDIAGRVPKNSLSPKNQLHLNMT